MDGTESARLEALPALARNARLMVFDCPTYARISPASSVTTLTELAAADGVAGSTGTTGGVTGFIGATDALDREVTPSPHAPRQSTRAASHGKPDAMPTFTLRRNNRFNIISPPLPDIAMNADRKHGVARTAMRRGRISKR
jgi:hypothetical protein